MHKSDLSKNVCLNVSFSFDAKNSSLTEELQL